MSNTETIETLGDTGFIGKKRAKKWRKRETFFLFVILFVGFAGFLAFGIALYQNIPGPESLPKTPDIAQKVVNMYLSFGFSTAYMFLALIGFFAFVIYFRGLFPFQVMEADAVEYAKFLKTLELAKNNKLIATVLNDSAFKKSSQFLLESSQKWQLTRDKNEESSVVELPKIDPSIVFDKNHARYRPELACALYLWLSFEANPLQEGITAKTEIFGRLKDWEADNLGLETFKQAERDRVMVIVNWDKSGNKFLSKK